MFGWMDFGSSRVPYTQRFMSWTTLGDTLAYFSRIAPDSRGCAFAQRAVVWNTAMSLASNCGCACAQLRVVNQTLMAKPCGSEL